MVKFLGGRAAAAVAGIFTLALGSTEALAQSFPALNIPDAVKSLDVDGRAKPIGAAVSSAVPAVAATMAMTTVSGAVLRAQPATSVTVKPAPSIATEAAWLQSGGWSLDALADRFSAGEPLDEQANCIATAVYFEARSESVEGQLAVARVIMNRAASGQYPASWCAVVKQPWQFSFVRHGRFPAVDLDSYAWRKALGVTRLAVANAVPTLSTDVLWYHADYVAPSWGRRLSRAQKIGAHIFYRA